MEGKSTSFFCRMAQRRSRAHRWQESINRWIHQKQ